MAVRFSLSGGGFYQSVRRILRRYGFKAGKKVSPGELIEFESVLSLDAPKHEVEPVVDKAPEDARYRLGVNHFGLLGTYGVLPLRYTEWLIERRYRYGDISAKSFLDIFNQRILSLLFQAWQKYHLFANVELRNTVPFANTISAITGEQTLPVSPEKTGLLATTTRSLINLQHLLYREFSHPVSVIPFKERWYDVEYSHRAVLGSFSLGEPAVLGQRYRDIQGHFLIVLGPVSLPTYLRYKPGQPGYLRLLQLVHFFTGGLLTFTLEILLENNAKPILLQGGYSLGGGENLGGVQSRRLSRVYMNNCSSMPNNSNAEAVCI